MIRGRTKTWVEGPVDFSDLRTQVIGLIYEGLLDYRLKRTDESLGPMVFLNIGRQPVLPLLRLEDMLAHDRTGLKNLLTTLRKEQVTASATEEEDEPADEETQPEEPQEGDEEEVIAEEGEPVGLEVDTHRGIPGGRGSGKALGQGCGGPGRDGGQAEGEGDGQRVSGPPRRRGGEAHQAGDGPGRVLPRPGGQHPQGVGDVLHPTGTGGADRPPHPGAALLRQGGGRHARSESNRKSSSASRSATRPAAAPPSSWRGSTT